ncbi:hypothetical protein NDU88_002939 [Pleurodeles waltl]|uniref:Uncharacterized protein n=1 Tax=Pleurodeles waltl TaxID=8319 RepID=A0AAV7SC05_PLEWA|nr:hypothetical protein NDU88_002939 [Pleurodeles waltl]
MSDEEDTSGSITQGLSEEDGSKRGEASVKEVLQLALDREGKDLSHLEEEFCSLDEEEVSGEKQEGGKMKLERKHVGKIVNDYIFHWQRSDWSTMEAEGVLCCTTDGVPCSTKEIQARPDDGGAYTQDGVSFDKT